MPRDDPDGLVLPPPEPPLNVVLVEPLIPQNTGNIARLCVGAGAVLHLVEPLGFDISEKAVRRAVREFSARVLNGAHTPFVAYYAEEKGLSPEEVSELDELIRQYRNKLVILE